MTSGNRLVRTWISLVIAVVFAIAAMPGSMAMSAPKPTSSAAPMMMSGMHECCDHAEKAPQSQDKSQDPCKSMAVCFGLLSCYGLAALPFTAVAMADKTADTVPMLRHQSVSGLSIPPDDPPPIAG